MSDNTENKSGWIKLDKGKRKKNEPIMETTEKTTVTLNGGERVVTGEASKEDVDELAMRLMETDSTMAIISQRQETGMANLNTRVNEHDDKLADLEGRLSDEFDKLVSIKEGVKDLYGLKEVVNGHELRLNSNLDRIVSAEKSLNELGEVVNGHELRLKSDQVQIGLAQKMIDELRADLTPSVDKLEELDVLRDKVRSQEAIIAELEAKVAKMESDVGETFAEAGRMIRDVKDESTQKVEEIAKEMETRLMERAQEDADAKLKEATRIQNKDITVMKQKMENVFSRMKRVEEDPSIKAMRLEIEHMGREMKSIMWVAAGALVSALALGIVTILGFAGGF